MAVVGGRAWRGRDGWRVAGACAWLRVAKLGVGVVSRQFSIGSVRGAPFEMNMQCY